MVNGNKRLYGQAFAIFGLAHALRVTRDQRYGQAALETWQEIGRQFADGRGGFRAGTTRDFAKTLLDNNPIMHLFEALLALHDAMGSEAARDGARKVGDFVVYRLLQGQSDGGAFIPELYDGAWNPLTPEQGGYVDVGHQFEWAFMLSAAGERGINPIYPQVAERLLKYAIKFGYDGYNGGAFTRITEESQVDRRKGYWQQAELLRALMHHAARRGRSDLWGDVSQTLELLRSEFVDAEHGGWYGAPKQECLKSECGNRQPDGYHMTGLHLEAMRLSAPVRAR